MMIFIDSRYVYTIYYLNDIYIYTYSHGKKNIGTLGKYDQRRL